MTVDNTTDHTQNHATENARDNMDDENTTRAKSASSNTEGYYPTAPRTKPRSSNDNNTIDGTT
eukprot:6182991-Alexandrium_andersonii.AAC.1